jgi:hypothetical protein
MFRRVTLSPAFVWLKDPEPQKVENIPRDFNATAEETRAKAMQWNQAPQSTKHKHSFAP